jgi:hypothetical protein
VAKKWSSHNNSLFGALLRSHDDAMLHLKIMSRGLQGFACQQLCTDCVRFLFSMRDVVMIVRELKLYSSFFLSPFRRLATAPGAPANAIDMVHDLKLNWGVCVQHLTIIFKREVFFDST